MDPLDPRKPAGLLVPRCLRATAIGIRARRTARPEAEAGAGRAAEPDLEAEVSVRSDSCTIQGGVNEDHLPVIADLFEGHGVDPLHLARTFIKRVIEGSPGAIVPGLADQVCDRQLLWRITLQESPNKETRRKYVDIAIGPHRIGSDHFLNIGHILFIYRVNDTIYQIVHRAGDRREPAPLRRRNGTERGDQDGQ